MHAWSAQAFAAAGQALLREQSAALQGVAQSVRARRLAEQDPAGGGGSQSSNGSVQSVQLRGVGASDMTVLEACIHTQALQVILPPIPCFKLIFVSGKWQVLHQPGHSQDGPMPDALVWLLRRRKSRCWAPCAALKDSRTLPRQVRKCLLFRLSSIKQTACV